MEIGAKKDGEWLQLNTNILQIENEYYSNIRPKRVTDSGERPIQALMAIYARENYLKNKRMDWLPSTVHLHRMGFLCTFPKT